MRIRCLPISGASFGAQLGIMCDVVQLGECDIHMCSSGGAVATYVGLCGDWTPEGIRRVAADINSAMFIDSWFQGWLSFLPSALMGIFKGSLYQKTYLGEAYLSSFLNEESIQRSEIWVGAVDRSASKSQFFCNRSKSILQLERFQPEIVGASELIFLNGNVNMISKAVMASASVPIVMEAEVINGVEYVDGGMHYASPLTALIGTINPDEPLHVDYISSFDLRTYVYTDTYQAGNLMHQYQQTIKGLIHSICLQDRMVALSLMSKHGRLNRKDYNGNLAMITVLESFRSKCTHTMLELYPTEYIELPIADFNGDDVVALLDKSRGDYKLHLWWIGDQEPPAQIDRQCN